MELDKLEPASRTAFVIDLYNVLTLHALPQKKFALPTSDRHCGAATVETGRALAADRPSARRTVRWRAAMRAGQRVRHQVHVARHQMRDTGSTGSSAPTRKWNPSDLRFL